MTVLDYLKSRKYILFLIVLCSIIHIIVLFAYEYKTEPVFYATVIYFVFVVFFGILDCLHMKKEHSTLTAYDVNTDENIQKVLEAKDPIVNEYQNIILKLREQQILDENTYLQKEKENSDFYTMWVHQIKTPIAALRILLQTSPENIYDMKGEVFKIEQYVDVILNYIRMDDMNQDLLLKHYSMDSLVKQAVKKFSTLFIQAKLSIKLEDLECLVLTDEKWLVFVIEQLLSNAIKYTKSGGIRIYANTTMEDDVKITKLSIEDTGIGIYPEDLPRIFERAFTGYNGRDDKKASGLGLYLCKTILQKLGHEIVITSEPKKGTCVEISFREDMSLCGNLTKM